MNGESASVSKFQTWGLTASLEQPVEFLVLGGKVLLKMLVSKSDSLSFLCRIYMVKGEIQLLQGLC